MTIKLRQVIGDINALKDNLLRKGRPSRVHFFEHGESGEFKDDIAKRFDLTSKIKYQPNTPEFNWQKEIEIQRILGRDIFRIWLPGAEFKVAGSKDTTWAQEHAGPIQNWNDLENYNWPKAEDIDYSQLDWYEKNLPANMGIFHVTKIWEVVRELLGFETFCMKLFEDIELINELTRRIGEFHMSLTKTLCDYKCVFAVYGADDYGFKTSTMMPPEKIKELFLGWHKKMSSHSHAHKKLYFMHVCGKVNSIMDCLIDDVKIDAKHSFEDLIVPVTEAKKLWGSRVGLLGGLDVDFVARSPEDEIRKKTREVLDICMSGGGYCLGLGNWVTSYIPTENYLAILDEGLKYNI